MIEPNLGLTVQSRVWRTGFLILAILVLACGLVARRLSRSRSVGSDAHVPDLAMNRIEPGDAAGDVSRRRSGCGGSFWSSFPSSWLMGVTTYLTTDLAAIPLFWIIPLALYLLSFILAFARSGARVVRAATWLLPYLIVPLVLVMSAGFAHVVWIPLHLLAFFAGSLACHGALAEARPTARHGQHVLRDDRRRRASGWDLQRLDRPCALQPGVEYPLAVVLACLVAPGIERSRMGRNAQGTAGRPALLRGCVLA